MDRVKARIPLSLATLGIWTEPREVVLILTGHCTLNGRVVDNLVSVIPASGAEAAVLDQTRDAGVSFEPDALSGSGIDLLKSDLYPLANALARIADDLDASGGQPVAPSRDVARTAADGVTVPFEPPDGVV